MRNRCAKPHAATRAALLLAAALLAVTPLVISVEAQASSSKVSACCFGQDDCQITSWEKFETLGDEATWLDKPSCEGIACGACAREADRTCRYLTEDMCTDSEELFCPSTSCADCLEQATPPDNSECMMHLIFRDEWSVMGNMAVFHQFQNRIVVESEKGQQMKALFHEHMHELGLVLLRNPDLLWRGTALLQEAAPGFRELLDQPDGEELVLTSKRVQTIRRFLADVAKHASPDAQSALEQVQAEFEAVEGMSLSEIRAEHRPE